MIKKLLSLSALMLLSLSAVAVDMQLSQLIDTPDPAIRGGEINYAMSLVNGSNDTAADVTLTIPLPSTSNFVSVDNGSCTHDGASPGTVNCNFGSVTGDGLPSSVIDVNLVIETTELTASTVDITATVVTSSTDTNGLNNSLSETTTISDGADLNIIQTDSLDPVPAGGLYSYSLTVNNIGPNDASTVTVTNTLPDEVDYVSSSGTGWTCNDSGNEVTCTRASIADGANAPDITITAKVTSDETGTVTNTANVSAVTKDPESSNNISSENTTIIEGTDLSITKTVATPVVGDATTSFTLKPRNLGPFSADNVVVTDVLPVNFDYISASGAGWSCSESVGTVTCTRPSYNVGETDDIVITTDVPAMGIDIVNNAYITSDTTDPISDNDHDDVTFTVVPDGADLEISKTKGPNPVAVGSDMASVIRVKNNGPQDTNGMVTVVDTLSADETYQSFTGTNWNCTHPGGAGGIVTCEYQSGGTPIVLANGDSSSELTIVTKADAESASIANQACVADEDFGGNTGQPDNVAGNHCTGFIGVKSTTDIADLAITKTVYTPDINSGEVNDVLEVTEDTITYTLTVTNTGDDIVDTGTDNGVVIQDTIPGFVSGETVVDANVTGGTQTNFICTESEATVQCVLNDGQTFGGSADGGIDDTVEITITTTRGLYDGTFTNTANVYSEILGEIEKTNNKASVDITIDPIADVEMTTLSISPNSTEAGTETTYVLSFKNNGPSSAANVVVTHEFKPPVGKTYELLSSASSKGSCLALIGDTLTCEIGTLPNDTATITLIVRPNWDAANTAWTLENESTIATDTHESDYGNNSQTADLDVIVSDLDLLVNTTDVSDPVGWALAPGTFPGSLNNILIYKVVMTNLGPSLATGVTLTDVMTPKTGKKVTFLCDDADSTGCTVGDSICNNINASATGPTTITTVCSLDDIATEDTATRYLYFKADTDTVPDATGDTHSTLATISSNENDTNINNDTASETTSVRALVDLAVTKNPSQASVSINEPFNWDIVVTNNGPGDSADSALSDNLPAGMELTSAPTTSQGACTGTAGDDSFTCDFNTMTSGAQVTVTVPVKVTVMPTGGSISNTAKVSSFGVDSDDSNDKGTGTVTITESSIAGTVYNDQNDNGSIDSSEHGISTVTMTLSGTDNWGNVINEVVNTDVNGEYLFEHLPTSDANGYTITETHPVNFNDGLESSDGVTVNNSRTTDIITSIVLPSDTNFQNYNFAELGLSSLQGSVWYDSNNDGIKDVSETTGIVNTLITLTGIEAISGKSITFTDITDSDGEYEFSNITAGTYIITETQSVTWGDGNEQIGSVGGTTSNDTFSAIALTANQSGIGYNFGELGGSITGYVYRDPNDNGLLEGGEAAISNVQVTLTGIDNNGFNINLVTTTDSSGFYHFLGLPASDATGYTLTETQPSLIFDGKDTLGTLGGILADDVISGIILLVNTSGDDYNFGEGDDIDSSISGNVFIDLNDDGIKSTDEVGLANISVTLTGTSSLGESINKMETTDINGQYRFNDLAPSDTTGYTIIESQPVDYIDGLESKEGIVIINSRTSNIIDNLVLNNDEHLINNDFAELYRGYLSGHVFVDNNNGLLETDELGISNVVIELSGIDINNNSILRTVTTNELGEYIFLQLPPSDINGYTVTEVQPSQYFDGLESINSTVIIDTDQSDVFSHIDILLTSELSGYNFAELLKASISGHVYQDKNDDGIKNNDEVGIENITLILSGIDYLGSEVMTELTTDENGYYSFVNLLPSNESGYQIDEVQPAEYIDGLESINNTTIKDSRFSDSIKSIVLTENQELENYNFGELGVSSLSGSVWVDENDNGQIDDDESLRIANVDITLSGVEFHFLEGEAPTEVNITTVTDDNGEYTFSMLKAGEYTITQQHPTAWMDGKDNLGTLSGVLGNDFIESIQLVAGINGVDYNFGERGSNLQGVVFNDLNDNALNETNEAGIPEVEMTLTGTDSNGQPVSRTTHTVVDGQYLFEHLPLPNTEGYQVYETQPEDVDDGKDSLGSHGGTLENDHISDIIFTNHFTQVTDYNFGELIRNPASISGMVWLDSNHNRSEDDGNGLEGWTVQLIDSRDNEKDNINVIPIATVITGNEGTYVFDGLPPGEYEVRFIHPQGGIIYGYPVSSEPGVDLAAGTIRKLLLEAGEHIEEQNLPIDPSGVVYDSQTRETVAGATVTLVAPPGFDPDRDLIGGQENMSQTTGDDGLYQFLFFTSAPSGVYTLTVVEPSGYLPGVSAQIPACINTPNVLSSPNPALVQFNDTPPDISAVIHDPTNCGTSSGDFKQGENSTQYYLNFNINLQLPSANVLNNHIPVDPVNTEMLGVVKTTTTQNASRGDLVPYTITVTNNLNITLNDMDVLDQLPPGFKYVQGSAKMDGYAVDPIITERQLTWSNIDFDALSQHQFTLMTIIGAGVGEGEYINQAWVQENTFNQIVANVASASVRIVPDPLFDCSDIIGKVFNDENVNGYQEEGEKGLPAVRLATAQGLLVTTDNNGRYHIACAEVPNEFRGSNFILKVDERTLPSGFRITSENPRVVRLTRGKLTKVNFGATIHRVVRIQLNATAFNDSILLEEHQKALNIAVESLKLKPSILRLAYQQGDESENIVSERLEQLTEKIEQQWQSCGCEYELIIEEEVTLKGDDLELLGQTRSAGHE